MISELKMLQLFQIHQKSCLLLSLKLQFRMRNSNSKQRQVNSQTHQRNVKTSQTARPLGILQNLNLNNPATAKKDDPKKQLPPKPQQKVQYKVDVNMTQSKIFQAKKGLQLLKKKMNRTGVSRKKVYSQSQKHTERSQQKISSNNALNNRQEVKESLANPRTSKGTTKGVQSYEKMAVTDQKSNIKNQNLVKQQAKSTKQDLPEEERPIAKQVDFMQLLQRQMLKQQPFQPSNNNKTNSKQKFVSQYVEQIILQTCRMGCGRNFNPQTLAKHEKICHKVFQSKRKAFDSAAFRQPQAEGFVPVQTSKVRQTKPKKGVAKWKIESAQLRAGLKLAKQVPLSKEQEKALAQSMKQCPFCGRKFNEQTAIKHIAFCQKKSKEIGKNRFMGKR